MNVRDPLHFLQGASPGILSAMHALGVAESLTDDIARELLRRRGFSGRGSKAFLDLLHCADYVVPRNSEWHFTGEVQAALRQSARNAEEDLKDIHHYLLEIGRTEDRGKAGDVIPAYLFTHAGQAFHIGELGDAEESLRQYSYAANSVNSGEVWLAGSLAQEQQSAGVLPPTAVEPAFLRAFALHRDGDFDAAFPLFLKVANSDSRNELVAWSMQLVGVIQTRRNHLHSAIGYLNRAVDLFTELGSMHKLIWALNARSIAARKAGNLQEALDDLTQAISLSIGDWKAILLNNSALTNRRLKRLNDAAKDLDRAREIASDRVLPSILVQSAALKREVGNFVGGLEDLNAAIEACQYGQMAICLNTRAKILWELGRTAEALRDLGKALESASPEIRATVLNTRSAVHRDDGNFDACVADNEAIHAIRPELRHNMDMAKVEERTAQALRAQAKLNAAGTESEIRSFWYHHFRSVAQRSLKVRAWYRAVEFAERALGYASSDDERFACYFAIGSAFEKAGEEDRAYDPLRKAAELNPNNSRALATLAHVMEFIGRPIEESSPYFERAIEADPSNLWAKSWYALALSKAEHYQEAIRYAEETAAGSTNAILIFNLARVLHASPNPGDRERAIEAAREAEKVAEPWFNEPTEFLTQFSRDVPKTSG